MQPPFDLTETDRLLTTTRAVRKRLDLDRPVPLDLIEECIELAVQAPTGSNRQAWRWIVVDDPSLRAQLGEMYRRGAGEYISEFHERSLREGNAQNEAIGSSALYLVEHIAEVPVHVIPCIDVTELDGVTDPDEWFAAGSSIYPAVWSFNLALRARGLGTTLTTLHLEHADEAAELLGIPPTARQVALLPVAYTIGTDFKPAARRPVSDVVGYNAW